MTWAFIMEAPDVPGGYSFTMISNSDRFILSEGSMNRLTIVDFDEDLDGSRIVCGIADHVDIEAAIFSLHVAGMWESSELGMLIPCTIHLCKLLSLS